MFSKKRLGVMAKFGSALGCIAVGIRFPKVVIVRVVAKTKLPHGDDHMVTLVCDCIRDKGGR